MTEARIGESHRIIVIYGVSSLNKVTGSRKEVAVSVAKLLVQMRRQTLNVFGSSAQFELSRLPKSRGHPREHVSSPTKFWQALSEYRFRIRSRESARLFSLVKRLPYRSSGSLWCQLDRAMPESRSESFRFGTSSFCSLGGL